MEMRMARMVMMMLLVLLLMNFIELDWGKSGGEEVGKAAEEKRIG
jgi:hypothetical protein